MEYLTSHISSRMFSFSTKGKFRASMEVPGGTLWFRCEDEALKGWYELAEFGWIFSEQSIPPYLIGGIHWFTVVFYYVLVCTFGCHACTYHLFLFIIYLTMIKFHPMCNFGFNNVSLTSSKDTSIFITKASHLIFSFYRSEVCAEDFQNGNLDTSFSVRDIIL